MVWAYFKSWFILKSITKLYLQFFFLLLHLRETIYYCAKRTSIQIYKGAAVAMLQYICLQGQFCCLQCTGLGTKYPSPLFIRPNTYQGIYHTILEIKQNVAIPQTLNPGCTFRKIMFPYVYRTYPISKRHRKVLWLFLSRTKSRFVQWCLAQQETYYGLKKKTLCECHLLEIYGLSFYFITFTLVVQKQTREYSV